MIKKMIKKIAIRIPSIKHIVEEKNALKQEQDQLLARREVEYYEYLACLYKYLLNRELEEVEIKSNRYSLESPSQLLNKLLESEEYQVKLQQKEAEGREYIICLYKYLLNREPAEADVTYHLLSIDNPLKIFKRFIESQEYQAKQESYKLDLSFLGVAFYILGDSKPISANTVFQWYRTAAELLIKQNNQTRFLRIELNERQQFSRQLDKVSLTIVTSLYKGEKYTKVFLENISIKILLLLSIEFFISC